MISCDEFIRRMRSQPTWGPNEERSVRESWSGAEDAAVTVFPSIPGVGFFSVQKRLAAFVAVCRHLDQLVDSGSSSEDEAQLAMLILRLESKTFMKAATMFDIRGPRYSAFDRAQLPRSANVYLQGLLQYS